MARVSVQGLSRRDPEIREMGECPRADPPAEQTAACPELQIVDQQAIPRGLILGWIARS